MQVWETRPQHEDLIFASSENRRADGRQYAVTDSRTTGIKWIDERTKRLKQRFQQHANLTKFQRSFLALEPFRKDFH